MADSVTPDTSVEEIFARKTKLLESNRKNKDKLNELNSHWSVYQKSCEISQFYQLKNEKLKSHERTLADAVRLIKQYDGYLSQVLTPQRIAEIKQLQSQVNEEIQDTEKKLKILRTEVSDAESKSVAIASK